MKNLIMITLTICFIKVSYGQDTIHYYKDGFFYTNIKSGIGEDVPVKFTLTINDIEKIKSTINYQFWDSTTFSNPANQEYIERWKSKTHIEMFLMSEVNTASILTQMKLKNSTSYEPISQGQGLIYVNDKNQVSISFPFKAQNDIGNMKISKVLFLLKWENGKEVESNFIVD